MLLGDASPWNKDSAALLAQFIGSPVGQTFLAQLAAGRPSLSSSSDLHEVALQAKVVAGYENALNRILSLTEPPEESGSAETMYPDLDDDSKWTPKTPA